MLPTSITIFTDGASRGNPGPGGYATIIIFPESNDNRGKFHIESLKLQVKELGGKEDCTTNNRMELQAAIEALSSLSNVKGQLSIVIYTDSSYLINGITKWIHSWQKNGWKKKDKSDVENRDLWEVLAELTRNKIEWKYIGGHIGIAGNHRCDQIATEFADGKTPKLYQGLLQDYPIKNILDVSFDKSKQKQKSDSKSRAKAKAYSYVSQVNSVIQTHKTWKECEQRVKGKTGAKFKKAFSLKEEKELIESWLSSVKK